MAAIGCPLFSPKKTRTDTATNWRGTLRVELCNASLMTSRRTDTSVVTSGVIQIRITCRSIDGLRRIVIAGARLLSADVFQ
jgi:hypothetical protein